MSLFPASTPLAAAVPLVDDDKTGPRRRRRLPLAVDPSQRTTTTTSTRLPTPTATPPPINTALATPFTAQTKTKTTTKKRSGGCFWTSLWLWTLRVWWVDVPLSVLFGVALGASLGVTRLYHEYYVPLMDRATRTDADLHDEFTYYHRRCTAKDVTTTDLRDVVIQDDNTHTDDDEAVHLLMKHGLLVLPSILDAETLQGLRDYAVYRNRVIPEHEEFPVSQGEQRISFGYDATEHPAVVRAIQQVAQHERLWRILSAVLGDVDFASTEITTITQYYGAPPQAWHSDTKADGNALKFGRTYSHSYSLFLPLQNVTARMGATDVCPGTHYCANDVSHLCETVSGRGLHTAHPEHETFVAGDGALLNQHVWHRGAPHQDPTAPARIVLILSFLARPHKADDSRQLSRGTYFHQKWNMWGHTWRDLQNPVRFMSPPWSYLKCLGLWNRNGISWGYDLVTATYLRFANGQLGGDLTRLVNIWDSVLQWPRWLRGTNWEYQGDFSEKEAWQWFLEETIDIWALWTTRVAWGAHALVLGVVWALPAGSTFQWVQRTLSRHAVLAVTVLLGLHQLRQSSWGRGVRSGRTLMRPFPPVSIATPQEVQGGVISQGPTTFPTTLDVLWGTRFAAPWLGAYERWLDDGHPGNLQLQQSVQQHAAYHPLVSLSQLAEAVVQDTRGRFLQQDYRTGDWRVQTTDERLRSVQLAVARAASSQFAALQTVLDRSMATYRFGTVLRTTALARHAAVWAWHWQDRLLQQQQQQQAMNHPTTTRLQNSQPTKSKDYSLLRHRLGPPTSRATRTSTSVGSVLTLPLVGNNDHDFFVGQPVWLLSDNERGEEAWYRGDVLDIENVYDHKGHAFFTIALETGDVEVGVPHFALAPYHAVQEGDTVLGCFSAPDYAGDDEEYDEDAPLLEDCYQGQVLRVMPDGAISIHYPDDDEVEFRKPASHYFVPPFAYELPDGQ